MWGRELGEQKRESGASLFRKAVRRTLGFTSLLRYGTVTGCNTS